ncbi:MAG: HD domain-containing protein [bacterium]|nr:HD domain-containing protein [bacterium]MCM1373582.1 HD domain-containing protein [Muribaculum sp.]
MAPRKKAEVQETEQAKEQAAAKAQNAPAVDFKKIITDALTKTGREGIADLLAYMDEAGFFTAPASGGNHSHAEGGLAEHSVNVMTVAEKMGVALFGGAGYNEIQDSVVIAALLHDLGKCGDYGKKMYVENILKSGKQSEAKPWKRNPELLPLDHATRSIKLATLFIDLTEEEEFAIRYHDGLYETANYGVKGHETKLYMLLHWADMWSSRVLEGDTGESGEE